MPRCIAARGPFQEDDERRLLKAERIDVVVTKNSGGTATYAKLAAARALGIEVIMVDPPAGSPPPMSVRRCGGRARMARVTRACVLARV